MSQALTRPGQNRDIRSVLEKMSGQFAMALPKILSVDRFLRIALTSVNRNPKLLACTQESLLACLMDCAMLGIEPDGRRAHLIPYKDKCTLVIDYKGLAELVRRSGEVSALKAGIVYPGDEFEYQFGTGAFLKHRPKLDRGESEPIAVYSYVKLKDGDEDFDVMGIKEVEKIRDRSQGYRFSVSQGRHDNPWMTDFDEMAKKTAFRRHSKWLPLSPELREKIEKDDEPLTEQERFAAARPIKTAKITFDDEPQAAQEEPEPAETQSAQQSQDEPRGPLGDNEPEKPAAPKKKKKEAPARATPLEALRNLIQASPLNEEQIVRHLVSKMLLEPHQKLEDLSEPRMKATIEQFMAVCEEILEPAEKEEDLQKEKAPY